MFFYLFANLKKTPKMGVDGVTSRDRTGNLSLRRRLRYPITLKPHMVILYRILLTIQYKNYSKLFNKTKDIFKIFNTKINTKTDFLKIEIATSLYFRDL